MTDTSPEGRAKACLAPLAYAWQRDPRSIPELDALEKRVAEAIRDGFESGFKAAGGAILPNVTDPSKPKFVEVALDQGEVDALDALITEQLGARERGEPSFDNLHPALQRFLEKITLHRSVR